LGRAQRGCARIDRAMNGTFNPMLCFTLLQVATSTNAPAAFGVKALDGSIVNAYNSSFQRNYVGIHVPDNGMGLNNTVVNVHGTSFSTAGALAPPFAGQTPALGTKGYAGIEVHDMALLIYGWNSFSDLSNGIVADGCDLSVTECTFADIQPDAAYAHAANGSGPVMKRTISFWPSWLPGQDPPAVQASTRMLSISRHFTGICARDAAGTQASAASTAGRRMDGGNRGDMTAAKMRDRSSTCGAWMDQRGAARGSGQWCARLSVDRCGQGTAPGEHHRTTASAVHPGGSRPRKERSSFWMVKYMEYLVPSSSKDPPHATNRSPPPADRDGTDRFNEHGAAIPLGRKGFVLRHCTVRCRGLFRGREGLCVHRPQRCGHDVERPARL